MNLMKSIITILILMLAISSCDMVDLDQKTVLITDYGFDLNELDYSRLFKNRDRLYNSHQNAPADSEGVQLFLYEGQYYYHPVHLCYRSLEALNDYSKTNDNIYLRHAEKSMAALLRNADRYQDMIYFPYMFDFKVSEDLVYLAPWYSGMAQGLALAAYSRLYYFTGNEEYTAVADSILRTMTDYDSPYSCVKICTNHNLLGYGTYYWVDEYPDGPDRFVLNGSIIGAMGLYDHWWVYGDEKSRNLFSAELSTVKDHVLKYRNVGAISAYCLLFRNQLENYHLVHINLLNKCTEITEDSYFTQIANLFLEDYPVKR